MSVDIFNSKYKVVSTITSGLAGPDGDWIDAAGNLYVADYLNAAVYEFAPGSTSPTTTYTAGLADPINVTTDTKGNVYAAEYNDDQGKGVVFEYAQGGNKVINQCSPKNGSVEGLAVDAAGDVFVSYNNSATGAANINEYAKGLAGCKAKVLGVSLSFAGGLQVLSNGTLVASDQNAQVVDIIDKPYNAVTSTIGGAVDPFHIALDKTDTLIFIDDAASGDVLVDTFPSGTPVTTLGSGNGLVEPFGVATFPYQK